MNINQINEVVRIAEDIVKYAYGVTECQSSINIHGNKAVVKVIFGFNSVAKVHAHLNTSDNLIQYFFIKH